MTTIIPAPQCLVCDTAFEVADDWEKGEIIECLGCGQEHEVIELGAGAVRVELAPELEEDWGE
ncbi:lysine biosynthesis protein LysW [Streptomyces sp. NBC_01803]|uniref:lysine biosynthesis protein LysW n=1 Tax=Streptomyces sp. NBC_01803 TaxID=2975946 RepID=UPI002DD9FC6F|nr:lysine biosynthesis protein LysW [Streptomyces sp. NBC_01803]WSA43129.1 lysine biosynthesis protein LysW [Streptomyces sp. NBC_01803]